MEVVKKGKNLYFLNDGYIYLRRSTQEEGVQYLKCQQQQRCQASATVRKDGPIYSAFNLNKEHIHPRNIEQCHNLLLTRDFLDQLDEGPANPSALYHSLLRRYPLCKLTFKTVKRNCVRRAKQLVTRLNPLTRTELLRDLENHAQLREDLQQRPFFRNHYQSDHGEFFLFVNADLAMLLPGERAHIDGTFATVPEMFEQLLSIHILHQNVWRTCNLYNDVLSLLRDHYGFSPTVIVSDFEAALHRSIREQLPRTRIHGCIFHFAQAITKKAKTLAREVPPPETFLKLTRMICAVPLLPQHLIISTGPFFQQYLNNIEAPAAQIGQTLVQYFEREWLQNVRVQALSVHGITHRTNNSVESFHGRLKNLMHGNRRPTFFIEKLKVISKRFSNLLRDEERRGHPNIRPSRNERRIQALWDTIRGANHLNYEEHMRFLSCGGYQTAANIVEDNLLPQALQNQPPVEHNAEHPEEDLDVPQLADSDLDDPPILEPFENDPQPGSPVDYHPNNQQRFDWSEDHPQCAGSLQNHQGDFPLTESLEDPSQDANSFQDHQDGSPPTGSIEDYVPADWVDFHQNHAETPATQTDRIYLENSLSASGWVPIVEPSCSTNEGHQLPSSSQQDQPQPSGSLQQDPQLSEDHLTMLEKQKRRKAKKKYLQRKVSKIRKLNEMKKFEKGKGTTSEYQ